MEKVLLKGLVEYQKKDRELYEIESAFRNSEEVKKYGIALNKLNALIAKIDALGKDAGEIMKSIDVSYAAAEKEIEANGKLNNNFEKFADLEEVSLEEKILNDLSDKIEGAEKEISRQKRKLEEIALEMKILYDSLEQGTRVFASLSQKRKVMKANLQNDARPILAELKGLEKAVDPKSFEIYSAVRKKSGLPAIVELVEGCCTGCGMNISIETKELKPGEASECPNCGRIIYIPVKD